MTANVVRVKLSGLFVYPVKSLAGIALSHASAGISGLQHDRQWAIFNSAGRALTQRQCPRMALIEPTIEEDTLVLQAADGSRVHVTPPPVDAPQQEVMIWKDPCVAQLASHDIGDWLTRVLDFPTPLQLMRVHPSFTRHFIRPERFGVQAQYFSDAAPYLLTNEASLHLLNQDLEIEGLPAVNMRHFRPNLVITGLPAFAEHRYQQLANARVDFTLVDHCQRCAIVTVDPDRGEIRHPKLLKILAQRNGMPNSPKAPAFGVNCTLAKHDSIGLTVGQELELS